MKKLLAILLAMTMVMALVACGGNSGQNSNDTPPAQDQPQENPSDPAPADGGSITLWTYPIGDWGKEEKVKAITDAFTADTGISV
ncbi:MAG: carbohydrate ABC transporter substrate-binding protein, partial [Oscillibacter sp.]|nr:carbohydrate ABC transporter substrate-binding protein [Oscillibacter sp.]